MQTRQTTAVYRADAGVPMVPAGAAAPFAPAPGGLIARLGAALWVLVLMAATLGSGCVIIPYKPEAEVSQPAEGLFDPAHTLVTAAPRRLIEQVSEAIRNQDSGIRTVDPQAFTSAAFVDNDEHLARLLAAPNRARVRERLGTDYLVLVTEESASTDSKGAFGFATLPVPGFVGAAHAQYHTAIAAALIDLKTGTPLAPVGSMAHGHFAAVGAFYGLIVVPRVGASALEGLGRGLVARLREGAGPGPLTIAVLGVEFQKPNRKLLTQLGPAVAAERPPDEGPFSTLAFDPSGALLATYDTSTERVVLMHSTDLTTADSFKPSLYPDRLGFSPRGQFLVIEGEPTGWKDFRKAGIPTRFERDLIQWVEVRNRRSGQTSPSLTCDDVVVQPAGRGRGRSFATSRIVSAYFSPDEKVLTLLCGNSGVRQRWNTQTWTRLEDLPPPPVPWWAFANDRISGWQVSRGRSEDGRIVVLDLKQREDGIWQHRFHLWDLTTDRPRSVPENLGWSWHFVYPLSRDGSRYLFLGSLHWFSGYDLRVIDIANGRVITLEDAFERDIDLLTPAPFIPLGSAALSPDGRFVAVAQSGELEFWRLDSGKRSAKMSLPTEGWRRTHMHVAFSPDSSLLAVAGMGLRLYRVSDLAGPTEAP